ncbi:MAG: molybdenum cofactor guanylyltransferase [Acidobacteriota bacterium]|nr:molybdenum cofactor guanylyltransferase [Acidobacteriota bacterium]
MNDIDGFILAGGASKRMGQAKANLLLGGKTFARRAASALSAVAAPGRLFIVGNLKENLFDLPILPDEFDGENDKRKRAAIVGLHAALKNSNANWAAVLACDLPLVTGELFQKLASLRNENSDAVVPLQPDGERMQPLCALYRRDACLPVIETILGGDDWSLQKLLRRVETRFVRFDEISDLPRAEYFFLNVNTPEDYEVAQAALAKTL